MQNYTILKLIDIHFYPIDPPPTPCTISYTIAVRTSAVANTNPNALMRVDRTGEVGDRLGNALNVGRGHPTSVVGISIDSRTSLSRSPPSPPVLGRSSNNSKLGRGPRVPITLRTLWDRALDVGLINKNSSIPVLDECVIECERDSEMESDGRWSLQASAVALPPAPRSSTGQSTPLPPALVEASPPSLTCCP